MVKTKKKTLIHYLGLLGVISFISYAVAVTFAPLAYPGYDWMSRAVSDLSAIDAPSLMLWNQLSSFAGPAGIVCITVVCVAIGGKLNKTLRFGIYIWAVMSWISSVGFAAFPLSESAAVGTAFQDIMHYVVTAAVVLLSIVSLVTIMLGGFRKKGFVSLATCAAIALAFMLAGGVGTMLAMEPEVNIVSIDHFGVFQRFSNLIAANGFLATLGIYLFLGKLDLDDDRNITV